MSSANEAQVGGSHYHKHHIQHWDWATSHDLPHVLGSATKYIVRYEHKGGVQDLEKAEHCLKKMVEMAQSRDFPIQKPYDTIDTAWFVWENDLNGMQALILSALTNYDQVPSVRYATGLSLLRQWLEMIHNRQAQEDQAEALRRG